MLKLRQFINAAIFLGFIVNTCHSIISEENNNTPEKRTKFDDDLRDFVEFLKLQMQCGHEPAGVPPLAPYTKEFMELNLQGNSSSFNGNFSDLNITGLNEFDVVKLNWNNILHKITFNFKFPSILAQSSYKLNALADLMGASVRFHGNGLFHLELNNLRAFGSFKLIPSLTGGLTLTGFKVKLEVETFNSKTTGIMDSSLYSKIFNSFVEEFLQLTFAEDNVANISKVVESLMVPPMKRALKNISVVELIALITGLAQDVIPTEAIC